jgi:hypothetical protein
MNTKSLFTPTGPSSAAGRLVWLSVLHRVNFSLFMVDKDGKEQPMVKITYKRKK